MTSNACSRRRSCSTPWPGGWKRKARRSSAASNRSAGSRRRRWLGYTDEKRSMYRSGQPYERRENLYDEEGTPQAVLIDLRKNRQLWEDFRDLLVAEERRQEPRESLEEVK